ncbi:MAG: adenylate/guanylate cyclase domain-containing protein [Pseudomonadota bacterium]
MINRIAPWTLTAQDTARDPTTASDGTDSGFTTAALERHKREGMELAVRARWIALAVVGIMLPLIDPRFEIIYYEFLLLALALSAWAQRRVARVGRSSRESLLILCDLMLMIIAIVLPNPLDSNLDWPWAMEYRAQSFKYFYILLAAGTLAYSWRTVWAMGTVTATLWIAALAFVWAVSTENVSLTNATYAAFGFDPELARFLDPNNFLFYIRVQEVVVFLIVAATLALSVRRYRNLLMGHAALERERANLARYFSPNVVEELSQNDEPLKQIRTQNIAVLFVDIVGFTRFAAHRSSRDVILTLREFHQRMEDEVFRHNGTLDKYLGDGLMVTFGTPVAGTDDALNALRCARAMIRSVGEWNAERAAAGEPPIEAGFGLHYGSAVLGDIGSNRLEFAVIGNTVNVASRVEALTRTLSVRLAATEELIANARSKADEGEEALTGLVRYDDLVIRGLDSTMTVWTVAATPDDGAVETPPQIG